MGTNERSSMRRRGMLGFLASASGSLAVRSLATGIPAAVLLDPLRATDARAATPPKTLVLACSSMGDPMNANVPGTYDDEGCVHADDPAMASTEIDFGNGRKVRGAAVWNELGAANLARTVFFHNATRTPVHGEMKRVQRMLDETNANDMLVSLLARELAPAGRLGTVQSDPVSLGASLADELLTSEGRVLGNVAPTSVRMALGGVGGPLGDLTALRDQEIDRVYRIYRDRGTADQVALLDAWARTRDDVRTLATDLLDELATITTNDQADQLKAAAVLAAMKISPVLTVRLDFGLDNHTDAGLRREVASHKASIRDLAGFWTVAKRLGIEDDVVFATLNVFGRTLKKKGREGRDHHPLHHVTLMMGSGLAGGVVGGVTYDAAADEYRASPIDAATGAPEAGGDIPYEATLAAAAKTLAVALGVSEDRLDGILDEGKVVRSALV